MGRSAPGLHLGVDRACHLVTGQQLGWALVVLGVGVPAVALVLGLGVLPAEHRRHVVEHEPLALGVAQHATVTAHRLGDEDALDRKRPHHARRVELDELHVQQRRAGPQCQGVTVTGVLPRVGGDLEGLADPAGGQHDGRRAERDEAAGLAPIAEGAGERAVVGLDQFGDRALGEDLQPAVVRAGVAPGAGVVLLQGDDLLLQRADELEPGAVADMRQPRVFVAAEVALADLAVRGAVEQCTVGLELPHPVGCLLGVQLGHPPRVEELAAAHRVAVVHLPAVLAVDVAHGRSDAALGHHGVRLAEQRLADDRHRQAGLARGDRGPQAGAARTDDQDVVAAFLDVGQDGPLS